MIFSRTLIIAFLLVSWTTFLLAQSAEHNQYLEDISTMSTTLGNTKQYALELTVTATQVANAGILVDSKPERILIQKDGNRSRIEREGSLAIREGNVVILIDDTNKTIASVEDTTNFASVNLGLYQSVLDNYGNQIIISESTDHNRVYQIKNSSGEIKFLEAEFDIKKGIFTRSYVELRESSLGVKNIEVVSAFWQNSSAPPLTMKEYLVPINIDTMQIAPAYKQYTYLSRRKPTARPVVLAGT